MRVSTPDLSDVTLVIRNWRVLEPARRRVPRKLRRRVATARPHRWPWLLVGALIGFGLALPPVDFARDDRAVQREADAQELLRLLRR
jgi:hypothetical protein